MIRLWTITLIVAWTTLPMLSARRQIGETMKRSMTPRSMSSVKPADPTRGENGSHDNDAGRQELDVTSAWWTRGLQCRQRPSEAEILSSFTLCASLAGWSQGTQIMERRLWYMLCKAKVFPRRRRE